MALNSTPGRPQSSENPRSRHPTQNRHPLRRTTIRHLSQPNYTFSDYQSRHLRAPQRYPSASRGGVWLGYVPLVPFGRFFV